MKTFVILLISSGPLLAQSDSLQQPYRSEFAWAPIFGVSPETSFLLGANGKKLFKPRNAGSDVRTSFAQLTAFYTLRRQFVTVGEYNVFTKAERWNLVGSIRYTSFPFYYFGIGNQTRREDRERYDSKSFSFNHQFLYRLGGKWFVGAGYQYMNLFDFSQKDGGLLDSKRPPGWNGSVSSGFLFTLRHDNRNSILNAYRGWYLDLNYNPNRQALGSTFDYEKLRIDARKYWSLNPQNPYKNVIAAQIFSEFSAGNTPFTDLSLLGSSMIMRGYFTGRFRDNHFIATQAEYRRTINNWLGVVAWLGAGSVASELNQFSFSGLKPNAGAGIRFKIIPKENLNLRFDYGVGQGTSNFYIQLAEAF
ncbi:BamA/TamA family outer membrane protein [Spirosoma montaniterrae]|uniref:Bacterial surface antigen (D15) domain-containing protein n=1 Tax=Spirosoma montaniterrae TaxID=1178516 RepID=A0A1P9WRZ9_9BACT|nr:BamA/TamA family outer membrane protein [Spirosoma montaniterrae]AQG78152.1 hypothetical protein AWR27_01570 [Spirosoma montaniterrae]